MLERGWIGSGNAARNTTIIRSNYLLPGNKPFYEWSMKLWEGLEQDAQFQRHGQPARRRSTFTIPMPSAMRYARRGNAMRMHGVDAELLDADAVRRRAAIS